MMGNREATAMNQTRNLVHRHKMTVEDFRKMGTAGILSDNERIEIIDGELIDTEN